MTNAAPTNAPGAAIVRVSRLLLVLKQTSHNSHPCTEIRRKRIREVLNQKMRNMVPGYFKTWESFYREHVGSEICLFEQFKEIRLACYYIFFVILLILFLTFRENEFAHLRLKPSNVIQSEDDIDCTESVLEILDTRWNMTDGKFYRSWPEFYQKEVGPDICTEKEFLIIR